MTDKIQHRINHVHKRMRVKYVSVRTRLHGRLAGAIFAAVVIVAVSSVVFQVLYPSDRLAPFTNIDGQNLSGWTKSDAIKSLDMAYSSMPIDIYFGDTQESYITPLLSQVGITANVPEMINNISYPWYLRVIPTSILWTHFFDNQSVHYKVNEEAFNKFVGDSLGNSCNIEPKNAELKVEDGDIRVIPSIVGGQCEASVVSSMLVGIAPKLNDGNSRKVYMPIEEVFPDIIDEVAANYRDSLVAKIQDGVIVDINKTQQTIPYEDFITWIDFAEKGSEIIYSLNEDRALGYFQTNIAPSVTMSAGTTTINLYNFSESSRFNGARGQRLDLAATLNSIKQYIDGDKDSARVITAVVEPRIVYNRQYSSDDEGLSALMKAFADSHYGSYGISLIELDGQNRMASYNSTKTFVTASTYKLFVAYSTLKKIDSGDWKWTDSTTVSGKNVSSCFDAMISLSDNGCAEYFLVKLGQQKVTDDAHSIGCNDTSFVAAENIQTTPADLALFLAKLKTKEILNSQSSRDKLLNAMSGNVYRQGIPAGLSGLNVADKVGFLWSLLHDAAIVTGKTGTYVLVVMTNSSSWSNIAELARQIEALRIQ
jgi:beta-lactamase class A